MKMIKNEILGIIIFIILLVIVVIFLIVGVSEIFGAENQKKEELLQLQVDNLRLDSIKNTLVIEGWQKDSIANQLISEQEEQICHLYLVDEAGDIGLYLGKCLGFPVLGEEKNSGVWVFMLQENKPVAVYFKTEIIVSPFKFKLRG